jgi:hypothetical protein
MTPNAGLRCTPKLFRKDRFGGIGRRKKIFGRRRARSIIHGQISSLGMARDLQDASRDEARQIITGALAGIIAAIFGGIAAWFTVWPRH